MFAGVVVGLSWGCAYPEPGFDSPDPGAVIRAIVEAAEKRDHAAIPHLVERLEHDDPAVRFAAIRALERITGETLGYDYAAPEHERRRHVEAWVRWYQEHGLASQPAGGPSAYARGSGR
jgi:HEAT repeat protein